MPEREGSGWVGVASVEGRKHSILQQKSTQPSPSWPNSQINWAWALKGGHGMESQGRRTPG